ncbi:MAG: phosphoglycerate dehydrogenase [Burkholderiales bacterium]|nr:phosphoglycerate dehydrogenase [Burkholderiales bacterium]
MTHRVLITGALHPRALEILRAAPDIAVDYHPDLPYPDIVERIGEYHALLTRSETRVTREIIDRGRKLKVIARAAVGIGDIDVEYATERGVLVVNTPGKNTNSAAELTFALLLALVRNLVPAHLHMCALGWDRHRFAGRELAGKTIGIVGLGNVGHRVARFARAFDMTVLACDPYIADEVFEMHGARKVDLARLLAESDVVTLHVPKTPETTGMIGAREIARMKRGAIVLNTSRGGIVEEAALLAALRAGHVAGAGIDTWAVEPPKENPFRDLPNVVMTPHIGASTEEAQRRIAETVSEQVIRALRDEVVDFPVNMPRLKVLTSPRVKTYTVLAEKLGRFAVQALDFNPRHVQMVYRGELNREEGLLLRRAFLKGFLGHASDEAVTFVNAEAKAAARGLRVEEADDPAFKDYQSALKVIVADHERTFAIGGVVFGEGNYRLSLIDRFAFEVVPDGHILMMVNRDQPGVIGRVGTILGEHGVNISEFELSRNRRGGEAMALIRVDEPVDNAVLDELRALPFIVALRRIEV